MKDIDVATRCVVDNIFGDGSLDLIRAVATWAERTPDQHALGFLTETSNDPEFITYQELHFKVLKLASALRQQAEPGDRVLILHQPGLQYVVSLLGCIAARLIGVPAYPPRPRRGLERLSSIIKDAAPTIAITESQTAASLRTCLDNAEFTRLHVLTPEDCEDSNAELLKLDFPKSQDIAYLQYTSGSTSEPRGVVLTHENLIHNILQIASRFRIDSESRGVIWLPPYHDMGLVGGIFAPLAMGFPCLLMSPATAMRSPLKWLQWIDKYRATISGGPNFAYDRALSIPMEQREQLDLSSWEVAFTGAEPISPQTLSKFSEGFKRSNFRSEALYPCYGLAEATLIVTGSERKRLPVITTVDADQLAQGSLVLSESGKELVSCGRAVDDTLVKIVDTETFEELGQGQIGEIWVSGPSVAKSYWNRESEHNRCFDAAIVGDSENDYLRTGDLGAIIDDELYVVGRIKELLIIRGKNFYPQDIEREVEKALPVFRTNGTAAFTVETEGETLFGMAIELDRSALGEKDEGFASMAKRVEQVVVDSLEIRPELIAFLRPGGIPRTSSGKLQRTRCAEMLQHGKLPVLAVVRSSTNCSNIHGSSNGKDHANGHANGNANGHTNGHANSHANTEPGSREIKQEVTCFLQSQLSAMGSHPGAGRLSLDSLQLVQLAAQIEERFQVRLSTQELFSIECLADLEALIVTKCESREQISKPLTAALCERTDELSAGQKSLWFIYQLSENTAAYNAPFCMTLDGDVDAEALQAALAHMVRKHSALRTRFDSTDGNLRQILTDANESLDWNVFDVSHLSDTEQEEIVQSAAWKPFQLESDPTLRATLFKRSVKNCTLLLNIHHISVDFWSFQIMLQDLVQLYTQQIEKGCGQLEISSTSDYARFVGWQKEYLASRAAERDAQYWAGQLEGKSILNLPLDGPRRLYQNYDGAALSLDIPADLCERMFAFCEQRDLTIGMLLLSGYSLMLNYITGQDDIVVGVPFSGRTKAEFAGVVGYFVNPLPMRVRMNGDDSVGSFLDSVRQTLLGGIEHQNFPSALLTEETSAGRDPNSSSLFQTMMVLNRPMRLESEGSLDITQEGCCQLRSPHLTLTEHRLRQRFTKFDLVLAALENNKRISLSLQYNQELLKSDTVARFGAFLVRILEQLIDNDCDSLKDVDPLTAEGRSHLMTLGQGPERDYRLDDNVVQRIERQVAKVPEAIAVRFGDESLTYRQVDNWANAVAHRLQGLEVGRGSFVGVLVDRSLELPVANLGVMKTGAAFVPLDVDWPLERLRRIAQICELRAVIAAPEQAGLAQTVGTELLVIDDWRDEVSAQLNLSIDPEDPIYAFSTSGSTGEPKCAIVPHRGIVNRFEWMNDFFGVEVSEAVLQTTRQVYDSAVWQLFWPMINGGTTVIPGVDSLLDCEKFLNLISHYRVTMTDLVPSVFNALLPQLLECSATAEHLRTLRSVIVGGEEITPESTMEFMRHFPSVQLTNLYGPTEASIGCIAYRVQPNHGGRIPIGRPIANVEIRIVDKWGRSVPVGTLGEIVIGGAAVGLGYVQNPTAMAQAFSVDPHCRSAYKTVYKTGDMARWLPDGNIDYCGRNDDQVKIRGHRIDLQEIEVVVRQHPDVASAVVTVYEPVVGNKLLVTYVVSKHEKLDVETLKSWIRHRLPNYMVPSAVVILDEFPITPGGKLDRKSLPIPQLQSVYRAPESEVERVLAELWQDLLKVERVGLDDNFFDLGGNSLLAAQLVARIESRMSIKLPLKQLFINSTLTHLAYVVSHSQSSSMEQTILPVDRKDDLDIESLLQNLDKLDESQVAELTARLLAEDGDVN